MLYMQADCYSRLNQYDDASETFKKLSKYYVEQFDIRIELGKTMFAQGTAEGYNKAKDVFTELSLLVAKPGSSTYKPKDYYNLQFWSMRSKLKAMGDKPPERRRLSKTGSSLGHISLWTLVTLLKKTTVLQTLKNFTSKSWFS